MGRVLVNLDDLQDNWNRFGEEDPFGSILTVQTSRQKGWDQAAFFATGERLISELLERAAQRGLHPALGRALDFGCGVGRLTQALADRFDAVVGVDIAPSMIELAQTFNRHGRRVDYMLNAGSDLGVLTNGFDFVVSDITLMHIEPRFTEGYITEFIRLLRPDGVAVFQLPLPTVKQRVRQCLPRQLVYELNRRRAAAHPRMEIYGMREEEVGRIVVSAGGAVVGIDRFPASHGAPGDRRYWVRRATTNHIARRASDSAVSIPQTTGRRRHTYVALVAASSVAARCG